MAVPILQDILWTVLQSLSIVNPISAACLGHYGEKAEEPPAPAADAASFLARIRESMPSII